MACYAFVFAFSVSYGGNIWLLRASGLVLFMICILHGIPLSKVVKKRSLMFYILIAVFLACTFGLLYFMAGIRDSFRREGEFMENKPFVLAAIVAVLPLTRALVQSVRVGRRLSA